MAARGKSEKDFIEGQFELDDIYRTFKSRAPTDIALKTRGTTTIRVGNMTAIPSDANRWQFRGHIIEEKTSIPFIGEYSSANGMTWIEAEVRR